MIERAIEECRADFPALAREHRGKSLAFLDGPAGSQVPQAVIDAVTAYYLRSNANSGGYFPTSEETGEMLRGARSTVAALLGAAGGETVSFGASMTTLTFSLSRALARGWRAGDEVVVTALDHEANRGPWLRLADNGITVREVALSSDGRLDADSFAEQVNERTRLVAIGAASNALGTVNDLRLARRLASEVDALLCVDGVHFAPHFPVDVADIGADFFLCSAYKFYGPHVGVLYARPGLLDGIDTDRLRTQSQLAPMRIETGTPNHAAIAGVDAAVRYLASWGAGADLRQQLVSAVTRIGEHEREVGRHCFESLAAIPGVTIRGPDYSDRLRAPTVSITIDGWRADAAAERLGAEGLQVWDGDFYAARAIESLGLTEVGGVVRTGVLMYNTQAEVDRLAEAVARLAASRP